MMKKLKKILEKKGQKINNKSKKLNKAYNNIKNKRSQE